MTALRILPARPGAELLCDRGGPKGAQWIAPPTPADRGYLTPAEALDALAAWCDATGTTARDWRIA